MCIMLLRLQRVDGLREGKRGLENGEGVKMNLNLKNNKASVICPQCAQRLTFSWNGSVIIEVECFYCHYKFRLIPEELCFFKRKPLQGEVHLKKPKYVYQIIGCNHRFVPESMYRKCNECDLKRTDIECIDDIACGERCYVYQKSEV